MNGQEFLLVILSLASHAYGLGAAHPSSASSPSPYMAPKDFNYDGRIVGGEVTTILSYPFQVSVQHQGSHICGGSILAANIILTAAHCLEFPKAVKQYRIRAGSSSHSQGGQIMGIRRILIHEAYNLNDVNCDVALMLLSGNLSFSRQVRAIDLPRPGAQVPSRSKLFVSGWGLTSETGAISPTLNHVAVQLLDQGECAESYRYIADITPQMFCAGLPDGGKDSCQGDSGGPLISYVEASPSTAAIRPKQTANSSIITTATRPIQYGIVSFGVGCAQKGYPGVYAKVAALRSWIDAKMKLLTKSS
ncbi:trypsin alpha [Musca domestica]|uniref:trypsin n=1 Tax=Musca domestica TaxID=7370 RepID=A0A1I8NHJ3_MUSDO|nr:trypsin alpha [Musca domestica]